jgi:hypothetical protein
MTTAQIVMLHLLENHYKRRQINLGKRAEKETNYNKYGCYLLALANQYHRYNDQVVVTSSGQVISN